MGSQLPGPRFVCVWCRRVNFTRRLEDGEDRICFHACYPRFYPSAYEIACFYRASLCLAGVEGWHGKENAVQSITGNGVNG